MDILRVIGKLAQQAQREPVPVFRVSAAVLERIRQEQVGIIALRTFNVCAAVSACAAIVILFLAVNAWAAVSDPAIELLLPLEEITTW